MTRHIKTENVREQLADEIVAEMFNFTPLHDLLYACKAVAEYAEDSANCGVCCYGEDGAHYPGCPVPLVQAAIARVEGK